MAEEKKQEKEGNNLLGQPTFTELENGRLKCVETGHELLAKDKDLYAQSKRCRLGLIDFAIANNKPPLNIFKQDPLCRSKLICKLTGFDVNKSEEHIWKHINGKRFLKKLEQKEMEKLESDGRVMEEGEDKVQEELKLSKDGVKKKKKESDGMVMEEVEEKCWEELKLSNDGAKKKKNQKKVKTAKEIIHELRNSSDVDSDSSEDHFWMPPVGERWDFDDGGDRWGSDGESGQEIEEEIGAADAVENGGKESEELSKQTKRMSIEIGPSSFASRKKKSKKNTTS